MILDEEQEHSYKSENAPRYAAKEVAIWRGFKEEALVLLGSATPSVESMYRAKQGEYRPLSAENPVQWPGSSRCGSGGYAGGAERWATATA